MTRWLTRGRRTSLIAAVVMSAVVLGGEVSRAWGAAEGPGPGVVGFVFGLTLAGGPTGFATAIDLNADSKQEDTLSVTLSFSRSDLAALAVGQKFESAVLQIFDQTLTLVATYRLSPAKVTAMRLSGGFDDLMLTIVLSGKTAVAISSP